MTSRKALGTFGIAAAVVLSACSSGSDSAGDGEFDERTIIQSTYVPDSHPNGVQVLEFMETVTERTGGAVTFEQNFSGALCPAVESVDCVADGRVDFGAVTPAYAPSLLPTANIDTMPFQVDNPQALGDAWREFLRDPVIQKEFESAGMKMIYGSPLANVVLGTTEPVEDVSDLSELTVRSIGQLGKGIEALGGEVVATGADELYESMQRGVVDAYVTTPDAVAAYKLQEVTDYFYDIGEHTGAATFQGYGMAIDVWNDLEPEVQDIMLEVGDDIASRAIADYIDPYVEEACDSFVESTNGFFKITDDTGWADGLRTSMVSDFVNNTAGVDAEAVERYTKLLAEKSDELGADYRTTGDICLAAMENQ